MFQPDFSRSILGLVRLVTRSSKARFGQVGDQVDQDKDQVGQGQGQELENKQKQILKTCMDIYIHMMYMW